MVINLLGRCRIHTLYTLSIFVRFLCQNTLCTQRVGTIKMVFIMQSVISALKSRMSNLHVYSWKNESVS